MLHEPCISPVCFLARNKAIIVCTYELKMLCKTKNYNDNYTRITIKSQQLS